MPYIAAHPGRIPDAGAMAGVRARPVAGGIDDHGRDSRTRRLHGAGGVRRPRARRIDLRGMRSPTAGSRSRRACATCTSAPSAPKRWRRASKNWRCCAGPSAPSAKSPSCCSTSRPTPATPAPPPFCRCSNRCTALLGAMKRAGYAVDAARQRRRAARFASSRATPPAFGALANVHVRIPDRRPRPPRTLAAADRSAMGTGAGPSAERWRVDPCARRALRQCVRRHPTRLRLRRRSDAAAVRERLLADARLFRLLSLAAARISARTRCCISARMARWSSCRASRSGLSGSCWPDRLIGDLPNLYLYASNNPSEGAIAKRRAGATLDQLSHAAGRQRRPLSRPDRSEGLAGSLSRLRRRTLATERAELAAIIQAQASELESRHSRAGLGRSKPTPRILALGDAVLELEYTLIPHGLHIVGEPLSPEERVDMLLAMAEAAQGVALAREDVVALVGGAARRSHLARRTTTARRRCRRLRRSRRTTCSRDHEIAGILRALDGRFIRPAPGGDLLRMPEILPTGRNLHGFDPFRIPSAYAVQDGAEQAAAAARALSQRRQPPSPKRSRWCCGAPTI